MKILLHILLLISILPVWGTSQDSFEQQLVGKSPQQQIQLLNKQALAHFSAQPDNAYRWAKRATALSLQHGIDSSTIESYKNQSLVLRLQGQYDSAAYFLLLAKDIAVQKYPEKQALIFNNLSAVYIAMGKYEEAAAQLYQALDFYTAAGMKADQTKVYINLGSLFNDIENDSLCSHYLRKALALSYQLNDSSLASAALNTMGIHHSNVGAFDSALTCFKASARIRERLHDYGELYWNYNNIGALYYLQKKYDASAMYFQKSRKVAKAMGSKSGEATVLGNLGGICYVRNDLDSALYYHQRAWELGTEINDSRIMLDALENIMMDYEAKGDFKRALEYQRSFVALRDSLTTVEKITQIADIQAKYETEKKENENLQLKASLDEKTLHQQWIITIAIVIGAALILTFMVIFYRRKLAERKKYQAMEKLRFKAVIEAEEKERLRIAKELHDGLGQLLSTAKLNVAGLEDSIAKEDEKLLHNSMHLIDEAVMEVRNISHNMMPAALTNLGLIPALEQLTTKINDSGLLVVQFEHKGMEERLHSSTEIALFRVVQEILNNMIKHAQADTIMLSLQRIQGHIRLSVTDNGIGFDTDRIDESTGIGWKNIFSRISMLNGDVDVNSAPGKGTNLYVLVPVQ